MKLSLKIGLRKQGLSKIETRGYQRNGIRFIENIIRMEEA